MRIVVTGSSDGLGYLLADALLTDGHQVIVHARDTSRESAVATLRDRGAQLVVGDLSELQQIENVADQVLSLGLVRSIVHNAGVLHGDAVLPVNVLAPYVLTARVPAQRHIYLSSGLHRGGSTNLAGLDWSGRTRTASYPDSKALLTTMAMGFAARRTDAIYNVVAPGWVPTKMGGGDAPDDLEQGFRTQEWLAVSDEVDARRSGGYWYHRHRERPAAMTLNPRTQEAVLSELERVTGIALPADFPRG